MIRSSLDRALLRALAVAALLAAPAFAQRNEIVIDAVAQPPAAETGFLRMGTNISPSGGTIAVNSRYLTRDGVPWLPVMGEFHYSRMPESEWETELLKMKAGGVQVVASYVIWIHHEEVEGEFDWAGQKDLRRFVELCGKHGLWFHVRVGPWSHAEVRNGGLPDWLVRREGGDARSNDSTYLASVERFYQQIGAQLRGLMWKDGGLVIGVQLENEYGARGTGRGEEHILRLKALARQAGLDAPLYTVTGWDRAVLPPAEVIPVFGGYPDWPWDASIGTLPPNEVYAFRFANRVAGDGGAQGATPPNHETSAASLSRYPFFGAEFAGGIQVTYHRRPVIRTDDIAAMVPVSLGSGVNLLGYYMFHGGTNPRGRLTTLQESQVTGFPTDVPVLGYDFQAPLSEFGEVRESFRRLKSVHLFLNEFGDELAPMVARRPSVVPATPADTLVPRVSARTLGDRGFLFVNNHRRIHALPVRRNFQVTLQLPRDTLRVPATPIDVPAGAHFIWPVNLDVGGARLTYSTAQFLTRVAADGAPLWVFFAVPGIAPEFAFDPASVARLEAPGARTTRAAGQLRVRGLMPGRNALITVHAADGTSARILLLSRAQAENAWRASVGGAERLLLSPQELFVSGDTIHLRAKGTPRFTLDAFPALDLAAAGSAAGDASLGRAGPAGIFTRYTATLPARPTVLSVRKTRDAGRAPPVRRVNYTTWRRDSVATPPDDSAWAAAATWRITVPEGALRGLGNLFLDLRYTGDVARLYAGDSLLDDDFFKGTPWRIGLARFSRQLERGPLTLRVMPLRADAPVYIEPRFRPALAAGSQAALLHAATAEPEYELLLRAVRR